MKPAPAANDLLIEQTAPALALAPRPRCELQGRSADHRKCHRLSSPFSPNGRAPSDLPPPTTTMGRSRPMAARRAMTAEAVAKALGGRKAGGVWMARCPSHDDRAPSLAIADSLILKTARCSCTAMPAAIS